MAKWGCTGTARRWRQGALLPQRPAASPSGPAKARCTDSSHRTAEGPPARVRGLNLAIIPTWGINSQDLRRQWVWIRLGSRGPTSTYSHPCSYPLLPEVLGTDSSKSGRCWINLGLETRPPWCQAACQSRLFPRLLLNFPAGPTRGEAEIPVNLLHIIKNVLTLLPGVLAPGGAMGVYILTVRQMMRHIYTHGYQATRPLLRRMLGGR